jgi:ATP-dependent Lon protease
MEIPRAVGVMILPNATLFPQAMLPLYIFEPRYRRMLADSLDSDRMFVVAMQKPGATKERPFAVAGLGLIRVCIRNDDGTSHVILQGVTRVEIVRTLAYKPYRRIQVKPLQAAQADCVHIDALLARVRDLVGERVTMTGDRSFATPSKPGGKKGKTKGFLSAKEVIQYLEQLEDPNQVADLVSCALLPEPGQRQEMLETVEVEPRLRRLIQFLLSDIRQLKSRRSS